MNELQTNLSVNDTRALWIMSIGPPWDTPEDRTFFQRTRTYLDEGKAGNTESYVEAIEELECENTVGRSYRPSVFFKLE